jgi:hypothetical protein
MVMAPNAIVGRDHEAKDETGFYRLSVGPVGTERWKAGVYIIGVKAMRKRHFWPVATLTDHGQTLVHISITDREE